MVILNKLVVVAVGPFAKNLRILCFQISLGLDNLLPSAPVGEVAP